MRRRRPGRASGVQGPLAHGPALRQHRRMDTQTLIEDTFAPLAGRRLLDVGCGGGALAATLLARGAVVHGVDVAPAALEAARGRAPQARFEQAAAQALPFPDAAFDGAILVNSLHHVPVEAMRAALAEALRVAPRVLVVEPEAAGSFFEAFRCLEDETAVRVQAQAAVHALLRDGGARLVHEHRFVRQEVFADLAAFRARVLAADPAREAAAQALAATFERDFLRYAQPREGGFLLEQPLVAQVLGRAG